MDYLKALAGHLWTAFVDAVFVTAIALAPLMLARLGPFTSPSGVRTGDSYWAFLTNGQLAFYSMGSLSAILLTIFRHKLPTLMSVIVGLGSVLSLLFLAWLVGIDPKLTNASNTFVGIATLYLYIGVLVTRILVDAVKQINAPDALRAGERASKRVAVALAERKGVGQND